MLTDYDAGVGARLAVREIPKAGLDDPSLNGGSGAIKWSEGNIVDVGHDWSQTDTHLVSGQSYDVTNGWGLSFTDAGLKIPWDYTGYSMVLDPDGTVSALGD